MKSRLKWVHWGKKKAKRKITGYASVTINEQNFPEFSLGLFSEIFSVLLKHTAVCSLSLTGLKILQNKHMDVHTHTHTHPHSPSPQGRPLFFQPRREWWLSLSPQSKRGHRTPISCPITLPDSFIVLLLHNFLSPVIRSASGSCCAMRTEVWRTSLRRHSWLKWSPHMVVFNLGRLLNSAASHKAVFFFCFTVNVLACVRSCGIEWRRGKLWNNPKQKKGEPRKKPRNRYMRRKNRPYKRGLCPWNQDIYSKHTSNLI